MLEKTPVGDKRITLAEIRSELKVCREIDR
jgi:hypothetical protein